MKRVSDFLSVLRRKKKVYISFLRNQSLFYWISFLRLTFDKNLFSYYNLKKWFWYGFFLNIRICRNLHWVKLKTRIEALIVGKKLIVEHLSFNKVYLKRKYYFSIGVMFKNESHILREWVEHYIFHGANHIYMINDGSTDDFWNILKPYLDSGFVTVYDSSDFPHFTNRQEVLYNLFFLDKARETDWFAILDMDEFLFSPFDVDLKKILKRLEHFSQIGVGWLFFSSNDLLVQPKSVVQGFTKRAHSKRFTGSGVYKKSVVASRFLKTFGVHHHKLKKGTEVDFANFQKFKNPFFLINHYYVQSREAWSKKQKRGSSNSYGPSIHRTWDKFHHFDIGDVEDLRLYEQNKEIIEKLLN